MIKHEHLILETNEKIELINITKTIQEIISKNNITNGAVIIHTKHTTSGIIINEDEEGLKKDYINFLKQTVPIANYYHDKIDNNGRSHIQALLTHSNQDIPIIDGRISLGIWQSIFFIELDGPRPNRKINITLIGE